MLDRPARRRRAIAEVPGIVRDPAVDVVAAAAVQPQHLADRQPRIGPRHRHRRRIDLHQHGIRAGIAGRRRVVLDAQRHDMASGSREGVPRPDPVAPRPVAHVPGMAGDRPIPRLRSRAVENDRLSRCRHPVRPGDRRRRPLEEDAERQDRPVPHRTRPIQHPKLSRNSRPDGRTGGSRYARRPRRHRRTPTGTAAGHRPHRPSWRHRRRPSSSPPASPAGIRLRTLVRPPRPRRHQERHRLAGLVVDRERRVVRHLVAPGEQDCRHGAPLLRIDLHGGRLSNPPAPKPPAPASGRPIRT